MTDRTCGRLDRAVVAYREDPTKANRARLMAAQREHVDHFLRVSTRTGHRPPTAHKMTEEERAAERLLKAIGYAAEAYYQERTAVDTVEALADLVGDGLAAWLALHKGEQK